MKVIKVIVDELPKDCADCNLMRYPKLCQAVIYGGYYKEIPDITTRPDWCPLVTPNEYAIEIMESLGKRGQMKKLLLYLAGLVSGIVAYHLYLVISLFRKSAQPTDDIHEWTEDEILRWKPSVLEGFTRCPICKGGGKLQTLHGLEDCQYCDGFGWLVDTNTHIDDMGFGYVRVVKTKDDTQPIEVDDDEPGVWDLDYWGNYVE